LSVRAKAHAIVMVGQQEGGPAKADFLVHERRRAGGDPTQEFFADGTTVDLITELSRIQALKASRTLL